MTTDSSERLTLTMREAAIALGVDSRTVSSAIRAGEIPAVRVGRRVVIPAKRFFAWLEGVDGEGHSDEPPATGADAVAQARAEIATQLLRMLTADPAAAQDQTSGGSA